MITIDLSTIIGLAMIAGAVFVLPEKGWRIALGVLMLFWGLSLL